MDTPQALDFCKFISETNRKAFHERKQHEWRVVFSVLTFYVLAAALKVKGGIKLPPALWIWLAHGSVAFITIVFLKFIHTANNTNKCIAHNAEHTMQNLLNGQESIKFDLFTVDQQLFPWNSLFAPGKGGLWSWFWKSLLIAIFALVSGAVLQGN